MKIKNLIIFIAITTLILTNGAFAFLIKPVLASNIDGTIDAIYKYAWGENIGWINFGTSDGDVHVTDSGLSGYALGENIGWIYLGDIINDGEGNLSGYAWSENAGWINFAPTNGGVIINSSGEFTGSALGENIGWIIFDYDYRVKTDWRLRSVRPICNNAIDDDGDGLIDYPDDPGCETLGDDDETDPVPPSGNSFPTGGGGGIIVGTFDSPAGPFSISVNSGAAVTNSRNVTLSLSAGTNVKSMAISSQNADLSDAALEDYKNTRVWNLCSKLGGSVQLSENECTSGLYTVYVRYYTRFGQPSNTFSDTIEYNKSGISTILQPTTINTLFIRTLSVGDTGEDVKRLQQFLNTDSDTQVAVVGVGSAGNETNYFGTLTENAVQRFQKKYGVISTGSPQTTGYGLVGPKTKAKLQEIFSDMTTIPAEMVAKPSEQAKIVSLVFSIDLIKGMAHSDIKQLQQLLNTDTDTQLTSAGIGSLGNETNYFGPLTERAVQKFQTKYDIVSSGSPETTGYGRVGPKTKLKLREILGE